VGSGHYGGSPCFLGEADKADKAILLATVYGEADKGA
jgi:hypothetical protein